GFASPGATLGTIFVRLERTSTHLFIFQRALYCLAHRELRHGSKQARGDNHFGFCTVGIDHQQAIVDEVRTCEPPRVVQWSGQIGFWVVALSRRAPPSLRCSLCSVLAPAALCAPARA